MPSVEALSDARVCPPRSGKTGGADGRGAERMSFPDAATVAWGCWAATAANPRVASKSGTQKQRADGCPTTRLNSPICNDCVVPTGAPPRHRTKRPRPAEYTTSAATPTLTSLSMREGGTSQPSVNWPSPAPGQLTLARRVFNPPFAASSSGCANYGAIRTADRSEGVRCYEPKRTRLRLKAYSGSSQSVHF